MLVLCIANLTVVITDIVVSLKLLALLWAAENGHEDVVRLLEKGANYGSTD